MESHVINHFLKVDPILHRFIGKIKKIGPIKKSNDPFSDLCEIIINQQLSEKAGATIFERFKSLFPKEKITLEKLMALNTTKIRACGTSNAKVGFLKNLASHIKSGQILFSSLEKEDDETVIKTLTQIKGVGPWTAEMFLMFSLGREDVFSFGDLGLKRGIQKIYKMKKEPTRKQMEKLSQKWKPYRTYAAKILWKSLEI